MASFPSRPLDIESVIARLREHAGVSASMEHTHPQSAAPAAASPRWLDEATALNRQIADPGGPIDGTAQEVGTPTPRHPSLRGKIGYALMELLRRPLWWYTWRIQEAFGTLTAHLRERARQQARINEILIEGQAACAAGTNAVEGLRREIEALRSQNAADSRQTSESVRALQTALVEETDARRNLETKIQQLEAALHAAVRQSEELSRYARSLRAELTVQQARLSLALTGRQPAAAPAVASEPVPDAVSALYVAFEDAFRGSRAQIRERQSVYLPMLPEGEHLRRLPAIDLGCGRGEWLELLREHGFTAQGVDRNPAMVEACRERGLAAEREEALAYLKRLPDDSASVVTAFHLVEHLLFEEVVEIIRQSLRVLAPGGLLILETPNPANVTVGSHHFYMDPTHQKPIPHPLLRFFVEACGFSDVRVIELHADSPALQLVETSPVAARFNESFYGPRDYAVTGVRPSF